MHNNFLVLSGNKKKIVDMHEVKHVEVFKARFDVSPDISGGRDLSAYIPSFPDFYKDLHHHVVLILY
jgi:hypothetical protein